MGNTSALNSTVEKTVLPKMLTPTGAIVQVILLLAFLLGPSLFIRYMWKTGWKDAVVSSLYAGILSFLSLIALNPLGFLALFLAIPVYMWALKVRLKCSWETAARYTIVIWGAYLLPLLVIGEVVLSHFTVNT